MFGNLPESRPGTRSPRRDRGAGKGAAKPKAVAAKAKSTPRRKPIAKPSPAAEPKARAKPKPPPGRTEPAPDTTASEDHGGGLEEIAWAGVAAAAEAATLGVRLANRALEALRGNSERS